MSDQKPRVFLHIGTPKTGTTFLQGLARANKDRLREAGLLFPTPWVNQVYAARDVLGHSRSKPHLAETTSGAWDRLVREITEFPGSTLVSMEWLCGAGAERAGRIARSFPDADVHIIITVRDTAATMPGQWQSRIRNGETLPWQRYVREATGRRKGDRAARKRAQREDSPADGGPADVAAANAEAAGPGGGDPGRGEGAGARRRPRREKQPKGRRLFLNTHGIARMLRVWTGVVPADHVHVVTVPPSGSDPYLLWRRFAEVLRLDPAVATEPPEHGNPSLSLPAAELLRRVNQHLGDASSSGYHRTISRFLADQVLGPRSRSETRLRLDRAGLRYAVRWNRKVRAAIESSGVHVVGDLDDLTAALPEDAAGIPKQLERASDQELLVAAGVAEEALRTRLTEGGVDLTPLPAGAGAPTGDSAAVDAAVLRIVELARMDMETLDNGSAARRGRHAAGAVAGSAPTVRGRTSRGPRGRHRARRSKPRTAGTA